MERSAFFIDPALRCRLMDLYWVTYSGTLIVVCPIPGNKDQKDL